MQMQGIVNTVSLVVDSLMLLYVLKSIVFFDTEQYSYCGFEIISIDCFKERICKNSFPYK